MNSAGRLVAEPDVVLCELEALEPLLNGEQRTSSVNGQSRGLARWFRPLTDVRIVNSRLG